jgi:SpoVK/Ycf46/Vps4 family AAA+-type ATPase
MIMAIGTQRLRHVLQVQMGDSVDIAEVARRTDGFSGADLQAIVSESQLAAVLQYLDQVKAEGGDDGERNLAAAAELSTPLVTQEVRTASPGRCFCMQATRHIALPCDLVRSPMRQSLERRQILT